MLATLSGIATVKTFKVNKAIVQLQLNTFEPLKDDPTQRRISGARWVSLNKEESSRIIKEHGDLTGSLIEFSSKASTNGNYKNYDNTIVNVLGGEEASASVMHQQAFLAGTGVILGIYPSENGKEYVKLRVMCKDGFGENAKEGMRDIKVFDKLANFFIERKDKLVGEYIEFRSKASSSLSTDEQENTVRYDNYTLNRFEVIYRNRKDQAA